MISRVLILNGHDIIQEPYVANNLISSSNIVFAMLGHGPKGTYCEKKSLTERNATHILLHLTFLILNMKEREL